MFFAFKVTIDHGIPRNHSLNENMNAEDDDEPDGIGQLPYWVTMQLSAPMTVMYQGMYGSVKIENLSYTQSRRTDRRRQIKQKRTNTTSR